MADFLKNKPNPFNNLNESYSFTQGKSCGALLVCKHLAEQTGILKALGNNIQGKLALFQIIARIVTQGSRNYIANKWSKTQAIKEVLNLSYFNEDDLYANLDWLHTNQSKIEQELFKFRCKNKPLKSLFLYDVTSSYLEGEKNELARFGYNRDGKKGKTQIVIGLHCDDAGFPISIEVFEGNTIDSKTVRSQIEKLATRFKVNNVVMVGKRGMIKSTQIKDLTDINWFYITSITKPQIEKLFQKEVFQIELFTDELVEVENGGIRYVLHRNATRATEIAYTRNQKKQKISQIINEQNEYLIKHPKAYIDKTLKKINNKINKLKSSDWLSVQIIDKKIILIEDTIALEELKILDGCYAIKTNVDKKQINTQETHDKYKDLAMVEQAFRTCKQSIEEIRPIFVRKTSRTKGHVIVCMLSYIIIKEMQNLTQSLDYTQKAIINQLNQLQYIIYKKGQIEIKTLPNEIHPELKKILECLNFTLPMVLM